MITIEDFPSLSHPKTQPHLYLVPLTLTSNPTNKRLLSNIRYWKYILSLCHHTPTNTRGCTASQSIHPPRQMCVTWNINFAVRHSQSVVATRCLLHLSLPPVGLWRTARTAARGVSTECVTNDQATGMAFTMSRFDFMSDPRWTIETCACGYWVTRQTVLL